MFLFYIIQTIFKGWSLSPIAPVIIYNKPLQISIIYYNKQVAFKTTGCLTGSGLGCISSWIQASILDSLVLTLSLEQQIIKQILFFTDYSSTSRNAEACKKALMP